MGKVSHTVLHPDFAPLAVALERMIARGPGGAALCVYRGGEVVADLWGGARDAAGTPWLKDTLCVAFSTTKGVTSTALHMLVDRGKVDYDDVVAKHWPEFSQAGKENITIRQVLSHQAGLFGVRELIDHADRLLDWEHMVAALAAARPTPVRPNCSAYHALTYGHIVGEVIRRVSGKSFSDFLREEIAEPLGLDGFYVGAPEAELHRAARLVRAGPERRPRMRGWRAAQALQGVLRLAGAPIDLERSAGAVLPHGIFDMDFSAARVLQASIPAGNGLFTARSLARMYAALANGGSLDGVRLLSPATLARATQIQTHGVDRVVIFPMRWRLGYHRVTTTRGTPRAAFGHYGFGGSGAWADPSRDLACAMVLNSGGGTLLGDLRMARISAVVMQCADKLRRAAA
jgi:CubicO group peptidase (beta-lactamase class C family)